MKGLYLTYISTPEGERKLVPRLEEHVILPELRATDVLVQIKACALNRIDIQTLIELNGKDTEQFPIGYEISGIITKGTSDEHH
jgi:NADPH:quinone reductase-like Zn-dependent oxidoreductase